MNLLFSCFSSWGGGCKYACRRLVRKLDGVTVPRLCIVLCRYKLPPRPAGAFSRGDGAAGVFGLPHAIFDTFPLNEDPVLEAEANVRAARGMWARAGRLRRAGLEGCLAAHDGLCGMRLMAELP